MNIDTVDDGVRPGGRPDRCIYCKTPVGKDHKPDCVVVKRTVVLRMSVEMIVTVPQHWDEERINFHFGESSHCLGNEIQQLYNEDRAVKGQCSTCHRAECNFVREATKDDHERLLPKGLPFDV